MDKRFIKALLEEGRPYKEIPQADALVQLNNDIMTVFVMNGMHRGLAKEAFKEEVRTCAVAMYNELITDPLYCTVRDKEIPYIFSNGMKGRLNTDKDIGLSYKNLIRWVEGYVTHQERKDAMKAYREEHAPKLPQLPAPPSFKDSDYDEMVNRSWKDWCEFKADEQRRAEIIKKGSKQPKTIGDIIHFPISCKDYGSVQIRYLIRKQVAKEEDTLIDVFERAWKAGRKDGVFIATHQQTIK